MSSNDKKDIERRIEGYVPRDIPTPMWEEKLRPFVIPTLHAAAPVGVAAMERFARVLTLIATWCLKEGIPLDIEVVLDPDTVERFCSKGLKKTASRPSYRATLRKLGRELTTTAPWEPRPEPMPARLPAPPYSETELAALIGDATRQSTPGRRRKARALIVLGVGAGLDGRWARKVRGTDVVRLGWGVGVKVGAPSPRVVPVLAAYEEEIVLLAEEAGDEYLVGGRTTHRNRTNEISARFEDGHTTRSSRQLACGRRGSSRTSPWGPACRNCSPPPGRSASRPSTRSSSTCRRWTPRRSWTCCGGRSERHVPPLEGADRHLRGSPTDAGRVHQGEAHHREVRRLARAARPPRSC